MKRFAVFALPMLAVFGIGLLFIRSHTTTLRPRLGALRSAVERVVEEVGEELEEIAEEARA